MAFRCSFFRRFQYYSLAGFFAKTLVFKTSLWVLMANATCSFLGNLLLKWKKKKEKKKRRNRERLDWQIPPCAVAIQHTSAERHLSATDFHQLHYQATSLSPLHAVIAFPSMSSAGHGSSHNQSNHIPVFSPRHRQLWWVESTCLLLTKAVM